MVNIDWEKPVVDEDVEVKRMKRLEQLRARRPYHAISEDGSGWIPLSSKSADPSNSDGDMSPLRKQCVRNDTPSPEPELDPSTSNRMGADLSPSHQNQSADISPLVVLLIVNYLETMGEKIMRILIWKIFLHLDEAVMILPLKILYMDL